MLLTVAYPTIEPITLEQARLHLRLDAIDSNGHPDDYLVEYAITAAREWCENFTGRAFAGIGYELRMDEFSNSIKIGPEPFKNVYMDEILGEEQVSYMPVVPFRDVEKITYVDSDGITQIVDEAVYGISDDPFRPVIYAATTNGWPDGSDVRIRFTSGYLPSPDSTGLPAAPASTRFAMLLLIGHFYANREAITAQAMTQVPMGVNSLLRPYRDRLGMA